MTDDTFLLNIDGTMDDVLMAGEDSVRYFKEFRKFFRKYRNTNRKEAEKAAEKMRVLVSDYQETRRKMETIFKEFERDIVK